MIKYLINSLLGIVVMILLIPVRVLMGVISLLNPGTKKKR
jgi:hypothetical protein